MLRPGASVAVRQSHFGHRADKATWLYYVGPPVPVPVGDPPPPDRSKVWVCSGPGGRTSKERRAVGVELMGRRERETTPPAFAEMLIALAKGAAR
jgi:hypothetical protein